MKVLAPLDDWVIFAAWPVPSDYRWAAWRTRISAAVAGWADVRIAADVYRVGCAYAEAVEHLNLWACRWPIAVWASFCDGPTLPGRTTVDTSRWRIGPGRRFCVSTSIRGSIEPLPCRQLRSHRYWLLHRAALRCNV